jgi:hypothetical protein
LPKPAWHLLPLSLAPPTCGSSSTPSRRSQHAADIVAARRKVVCTPTNRNAAFLSADDLLFAHRDTSFVSPR